MYYTLSVGALYVVLKFAFCVLHISISDPRGASSSKGSLLGGMSNSAPGVAGRKSRCPSGSSRLLGQSNSLPSTN